MAVLPEILLFSFTDEKTELGSIVTTQIPAASRQ